jgi:hypothetical protein
MKLYQPDRKDLLTNTEWGIPKDKLSIEEANKQDLVLFKNKWVSKAEKKTLTKQYKSYLSIRQGIIPLFLLAPILLFLIIFLSKHETIISGQIKLILGLIVSAGVNIIVVIGLWNFSNWGRWLATVVIVLSIVLSIIFYDLNLIALFIGLLGLYYLHNDAAVQIFSGPPK